MKQQLLSNVAGQIFQHVLHSQILSSSKGSTLSAHYPLSDVSYLPLHLFSLSSSVFYNQLAPQHTSLIFLSLSILTVCSVVCSDCCISFYTNLSALTVAVVTHHCHGNPNGLGGGRGWGEAMQDRMQRHMKERERQAESGESRQSFLIKRYKEGTRLLINVPMPVYQHKISGRHLLRVNSKGTVHLLA